MKRHLENIAGFIVLAILIIPLIIVVMLADPRPDHDPDKDYYK